MARRRRAIAASAVGGAADAVSQLLRDRYLMNLAMKRMEEQNRLVMERQAEQDRLTTARQEAVGRHALLLNKLFSDPRALQRALAAGWTGEGDPPLAAFLPSREEAVAGAAADIEGVSSLASLPTQSGLELTSSMRPGFPAQDPEALGTLTRLLAAREARIKAAAPPQPVETLAPGPDATVAKATTFRSPWDLAGQVIQQEPFPEQAGRAEGIKTLAGMNIPGLQERLLDFEQKKQTAKELGALTPEVLKGKAQLAAISAGEGGAAKETIEQATARGFLIPMLAAETNATALENQGTAMGVLTQTLMEIPGGPYLIPEKQQHYYVNAESYINLATRIMSGTAARPDEKRSYISALFGVAGESTSTTKLKQDLRRRFSQAVLRRAGSGATLDDVAADIGLTLPGVSAPGVPAPGITAPGPSDALKKLRQEQR